MSKKELNRMLKALEIAKIMFEYEGYHTDYLENIECLLLKLKGSK